MNKKKHKTKTAAAASAGFPTRRISEPGRIIQVYEIVLPDEVWGRLNAGNGSFLSGKRGSGTATSAAA